MTHFVPGSFSQWVPRWEPARVARNLEQIQHRVERQRRRLKFHLALAAVVTSVSVSWFGFGLWHAQTLRSAPTARTGITTETRFSDGSVATALTPGAVLELQTSSVSEMVVGAKSGSYRFDVVPNPARQFVVHVASVTVRVLGTQFVVAKTGGRAEVRVERGRVEVTWPEGRTELGVGESGWFPPEPPALAAAAASTVPSPWPSAVKGPPSTKNRAQFIELSRQGNYQAAYAMIDRTPTPFEGSAEDLMMAADAARLSNHPSQAIVYLQRITRDYSRDSRAPLAAFTIGRICMNQLARPAAAAEAFGLVRRLAPAGALVQDALAREAEALEQAGQHAAAQRLVEEYLKLYPSGRSRERLRQLGKPTKSE